MYNYSAHDLERKFNESPKGIQLQGSVKDSRNTFEHDRARVLHSAAFRRLADKTQVVVPGQGDTPRTRLTHSLEVGQISRGIGSALGADSDLCELAGLSHDIGHPPYGHNGETALNDAAQECGGFEGNAQTIRILTRLEPKVMDSSGISRGLNLSRASLDATCKYPWGPVDSTGYHLKKYSAYEEDLPVLDWIREGAPESQKNLEAQIMDLADDIAYSVHDVEDGILAGHIDLNILWDIVELAVIADEGAQIFGGTAQELVEASQRLEVMPILNRVSNFSGSLEDLAALKTMTSELVGRFITATVTATKNKYGNQNQGRYSANLVIPTEIEAEIRLLKFMAVRYIMQDPHHVQIQRRQSDTIFRVVDYFYSSGVASLDPLFAYWWEQASTSEQRLRVVIDQVASLTESRLERIDKELATVTADWN